MAGWSQASKLRAGLVLIGALAILSSGTSFLASKGIIQSLGTPADRNVDLLGDSQALGLAGLGETSNATAALFTGEERYARAARSASVRVRDRATHLEKRVADGQARSLLQQVKTTELEYREAFESALATPPGGHDVLLKAAVGSRGAAFEQALNALVAHVTPGAIGGLAATRASAERSQIVLNLITGVSIALAALLCVMLILLINRGHRERTSARIIAEEGLNETTMALDAAKATIHMKDQFLATVSHELRNPLAPILTWTQLLRSGTLDTDKSNRGLEVIERNVRSLSELIDDLVDASRVVSGKFRLDVRAIDLEPVIRAAVESQRPAIDAKQIRVSLVLDERTGTISGDFERLQQVMGNLLANAVKFTAKGGRVQIVLGRVESHVQVRISDDGIGIEPAFLPHIFEPFQQQRDGSMRRHGGLGLGLSIVHHIVQLHGGEIIAQSAGTGQGSAFTIKLPLLGTGAQPDGQLSRHPSAGDGLSNVMLGRLDRIRVLLVDDEPNANEAVQTLLDSCGAEVRVAGSAAQALHMLDIWKPDVLITDIAMPEEDGYVLIKKIRARSAEMSGNIPAAALTAYAKIEDRVSILAAGFQMYLSKPADPSELIAVVASLASHRRRGLPAPPAAN